MRRFGPLVLAAAALAAGCAGAGDDGDEESASPAPPQTRPAPQEQSDRAARQEARVREWSEALNAGDNEAAGRLFAPEAVALQGGVVIVLRTYRDAVRWNAGLPCSGRLVEATTQGRVVTAIFVLGHRPTSQCDAAPGTRAAARFHFRGDRIVAFEQIPVPDGEELEA